MDILGVVLLHLLIWDANTGRLLEEVHTTMPSYIRHPDSCLAAVLPQAKERAMKWRETHPNAFANIDCEFGEGSPSDPA